MTALDILLLVTAILIGLPVLLLVASLPFVPFVRGPEDSFFYGWVRVVNHVYCRVYHGVRIPPGADVIPATGPCIIVANHRSGCDPLLVCRLTPRVIRFLMAREYYETRGLSWIFRSLRAIPVNRNGNDLGAMREAIKYLRAGGIIGLFPQGGIREADDSLGEGKSGVALLALRTGAPVLPVYIDGWPSFDSVAAGVLVPTRTRLIPGELLELDQPAGKPSREDLDRLTARILEEIRDLKNRAEAGSHRNVSATEPSSDVQEDEVGAAEETSRAASEAEA